MVFVKSYKDLIVWQKSITLVQEIYLLTNNFPKNELYGLSSQMQRAADAIPSNIAEGYGRKSSKEYLQFLSIAFGSALELETQLIIVKNLKFVDNMRLGVPERLLEEILKMLNVMTRKRLDAKR